MDDIDKLQEGASFDPKECLNAAEIADELKEELKTLEGIVQSPQQKQARFQNLTACTDFIRTFGICPCNIEKHGVVYVLTYFNSEV